MALFDNTMQTGAQAQQLGFAPPTTPANSFTPPGVPVGYGQMQGQPLLSRNPNYGVPTGIASLLGGTNPMGAPQAGAFLAPQQAVPNQMEGINPITGQAFQTFDATETANIFTQGRVAQEQAAAAAQAEMLRQAQEQAAAEAAASEAAAQAERDRIAAEQAAVAQAEADRIAAEQAAADAAAAEAAAVEAANAKLDPQTPEEIVQGYKDNPQSAPGAGGVLGEEQVAKALELDLFDRDSDFFVDRSGLFGPAGTRYDLPNMDDTQTVLSDMRQTQTGSASPTQEEISAAIRSGIDFGGEGMGSFMPDLRPGSFDPESGTFLPTGPAAAPAAAPAADPAQAAAQAAPIAGGSEMGFVPPTQEQINAAIAQMSQVSLAPGEPSLPPLNVPAQAVTGETEIGLGDRLRGMGGIFANAVAPGDVGYEELAAAAAPTGGGIAGGVMRGEEGNLNLSSAFPIGNQRPAPTPRPVSPPPPPTPFPQAPAPQAPAPMPVPPPGMMIPIPEDTPELSVFNRFQDFGERIPTGGGRMQAAPTGIDALLDVGRAAPTRIPTGLPPVIERPPALPPRADVIRPPLPPPPPPPPAATPAEALQTPVPNVLPPPPPMITPADLRAAAVPAPIATPDLAALRRAAATPAQIATPDLAALRRAAATPTPIATPDLAALRRAAATPAQTLTPKLPPKPKTQKVTKPKKGKKKVAQPSKKRRSKRRGRR